MSGIQGSAKIGNLETLVKTVLPLHGSFSQWMAALATSDVFCNDNVKALKGEQRLSILQFLCRMVDLEARVLRDNANDAGEEVAELKDDPRVGTQWYERLIGRPAWEEIGISISVVLIEQMHPNRWGRAMADAIAGPYRAHGIVVPPDAWKKALRTAKYGDAKRANARMGLNADGTGLLKELE